MADNRALVIVDIERDFCPGGSLAVHGGDEVAQRVSAYLDSNHEWYKTVVATKDFHVSPGDHWAEHPDFLNSWPVHCEVGTEGVQFHPDLDLTHVNQVFYKGRMTAAYSGFEAICYPGWPVTDLAEIPTAKAIGDPVSLPAYLQGLNVNLIDVVGIATDYCVKATALDGVKFGFATNVLLHFTASVAPDTGDAAVKEMHEAGVGIVTEAFQ